METLLAAQQLLSVHVLAVDPLVAQSSQGLVTTLRNFILPLLSLACGIAAIGFLWQRQMTQMIIFVVIAVVVFAIFMAPEMISNLGTRLGQNNSNW